MNELVSLKAEVDTLKRTTSKMADIQAEMMRVIKAMKKATVCIVYTTRSITVCLKLS